MSSHCHKHEHVHEHEHSNSPAHIHSHRNIIGFDEHGVPTVILKASHGNEESEDPQAFIKDYMNAVSEYRKTFPSKQDVIEQTPDPAVREMLLRMEQLGIDTAFDRFDKQKPQCNFGLAGICCKICNMGPCRITPKAPRGICGCDAAGIVGRNYLKFTAGGGATHSDHGREICHTLYQAKPDGAYKVKDPEKLIRIAKEWGVETEGKDIYDLAHEMAETGLMEYGKPFG